MPVDLLKRQTEPRDLFQTSQAPRDLFATPSLNYEAFDKENKPITDIFGTPIPKIKDDISFPEVAKKGVESIVRPFKAQAYKAAEAVNKGLESFSGNLDKISRYIEKKTGLKRGGIFESAAKTYKENAEYWNKRAEEVGVNVIDEIVGTATGGAVPGVGEFLLNVPYYATLGAAQASEEGKNEAMGAIEAGAKRLLLGKVLHQAGALKQPLRSATMGTVFAADAPEGEKVKAFGIGALLGLPGSGKIGMQEVVKAAKSLPKEIQASNWYRKMTIKERGLMVLDHQQMKSAGWKEADIIRQLKKQGESGAYEQRLKEEVESAKAKEQPKATPEQLKDLKDKFQEKRVEPEVSKIRKPRPPQEKGFTAVEDVQESVRREAGFAPENIDKQVAKVKSDYWNKKITKEKAFDTLQNLARFSDKDIEFNLERRKEPREKEIVAEAKGEAKELWQMTGEEFKKQWDREMPSNLTFKKSGKDILADTKKYGMAGAEHKWGIEGALKEGKSIPAEVLKEYPELQPQKQGFTPIEGFKLATEEGRKVEGKEPVQVTDLFTKQQFTQKLSPEEVKAQAEEPIVEKLKGEQELPIKIIRTGKPMTQVKFNPEKHTLKDFVAIKGGINPKGLEGEFKSLVGETKAGKFLQSKTGLTVDDMRMQAIDQGFLDEWTSPDDFLAAVKKDLMAETRLERVWSSAKDIDTEIAKEFDSVRELRAQYNYEGIPYSKGRDVRKAKMGKAGDITLEDISNSERADIYRRDITPTEIKRSFPQAYFKKTDRQVIAHYRSPEGETIRVRSTFNYLPQYIRDAKAKGSEFVGYKEIPVGFPSTELYSGIPIDKIFKMLRGKKKPSSKVQKVIDDAFISDFKLDNISDETLKGKGLSENEISEVRKIALSAHPSDAAFSLFKTPRGEVIKEIPKMINRGLGVISTRLANIHPSLKYKVRRNLFDSMTSTFKDINYVKGFVEGYSKLTPEQQFNFSRDVFNGDFDSARKIISFGQARQTIGFLRKQAKVAGYDLGFIKNYWPRVVGDVEGLLTELRGMKEWTAIDEAIKRKEKELGELTADQKAAIADTMLRGFPREGVSLKEPFTDPAHAKKRTIAEIDKKLMKYYLPADKSLLMYISTMNGAISKAKFFGKSRKPLTTEPSLPGIETKKQITDSIGDLVIDLKDRGILKTAEQERDLRGMLYALFNPKKTSKIVTQLKQGIYATLLTNISPALTQIGDLALTSHKAGIVRNVYKVADTLARTIAKKHRVDLKDIGLEADKIIHEIDNQGALGWVLQQGLEWSMFAKTDRFAKRNFLNAALSKAFGEAKRNNKELIAKLDMIFKGEAGQVLTDLKNKNVTEDVKFYLFNELSDIQPITKAEVPEKYLRVDGGKLFYVLKTYQIKLWDVYINDVYNEFRKKGGKTGGKGKAFKNFLRLTTALVLMNGLSDQLKDFVLGRETKFEDQFMDQFLRLSGISKYTIWRARRYGLGDAIVKTLAPPVGVIDDIGKDIDVAIQQLFYDEKEDQKFRSTKYIPIGGKPYYWWYGRGADIKLKYQSSDLVDEYNIAIDKGDKNKMAELKKLYKAKHDADIQEKADNIKRYELRNQYKITGNIKDIENIKRLAKMPKADSDRLIKTYEYKTQMKLRYYMKAYGGR